jgi:hypothetical protein
MGMSRTVIEDLEVPVPPDQVMAQLTTTRDSWRVTKDLVTFRFDLVGEHVQAKLRITQAGPALLVLVCESETGDLGWAKTRITIALARTATGTRIALIHPGPLGSATRDVWAGFLADIAVRCSREAVRDEADGVVAPGLRHHGRERDAVRVGRE